MVERNLNPQGDRNAAGEANPLPPSGGVRNELDTGMPGFEVAGRVYTFAPGDPGREEMPPLADRGMIPRDDNIPFKKDLSKTTKDTLARYLSNGSTINRYPITVEEPDPWVPLAAVLPNSNVTPQLPPPTEPTRNGRWFTQGLNVTGGPLSAPHPDLRGWRPDEPYTSIDSVLGPEPEQLNIKKGKDPRGSVDLDGNGLLSRAPASELRKVPNAVLKNNRFSSSVRYASTPEGGTSFGGGEATQALPRSFDPSAYNQAQYHPIYGEVSIDRLAQIGSRLTSTAADDFSLEVSGESVALKKVELVKLEAADAIKAILAEPSTPANFVSPIDGSWGALTNTDNYFDGLSTAAMKAMAVALSTSVFVLGEVLGRTIAAFLDNNKGFDPNDEGYASSLRLGMSRISAQRGKTGTSEWYWDVLYDITGFFGIIPTKNAYTSAVYEGISALFGRKSSSFFKNFGIELPPELELFAGSAQFATTAAGYVTVISRAFLRSLVVFHDSFAQLTASAKSTEEQVVDGVRLISESKAMKILNAIAALGDGVISNEEYRRGVEAEGSNAFNVHSMKMKKDFGPGDLRSSTWASNSSPSLYLIPDSVRDLGGKYIDTQGYASLPPITGSASFSSFSGKIDKLQSEAMEATLDAAYVPFYFHDLRTNEIISFHAFLESLSDSFSVSYETSEGFGRVEPVKVYKGTTRSISINFFIAAHNKSDFDEMWFKINKLVTLIYPQYTEGRKLETGGYRFIQPFSQMVGASPLIRIRLGELFHSNYSRFALARLFGATLGDTSFDRTPGNAIVAPNQYVPTFEEIFKRAISKKTPFSIFPDAKFLVERQEISLDDKQRNYLPYLPFICSTRGGQNAYIKLADINTARSYWNSTGVLEQDPDPAKLKRTLTKEYLTDGFDKLGKESILVGNDLLYLQESYEKQLVREIQLEKNENFIASEVQSEVDGLTNFMDPKNNAVVKSFESVSGKGLAGVIDSISFDWLENFTWETEFWGATAPKMCRVQISFSPIHDISPGIDSEGYNRAPVYPVRRRG